MMSPKEIVGVNGWGGNVGTLARRVADRSPWGGKPVSIVEVAGVGSSGGDYSGAGGGAGKDLEGTRFAPRGRRA